MAYRRKTSWWFLGSCVTLFLWLTSSCIKAESQFSEYEIDFKKSEFLPQSDGWPQARRRKIITRYLQQIGIPNCSVNPRKGRCHTPNGISLESENKYRATEIIIFMLNPNSRSRQQISYALKPGSDGQVHCDEKLFRVLEALQKPESPFAEIHLTMNDEACP